MSHKGQAETAVLYMRVSIKRQADQGHSLEDQDKELPAFCERKAIRVLATFSDPGESGRTMDRPGFQRLMEYCKANHPTYVVVSAYSRFARNVKGQIEAIGQLSKYGTAVLSVGEPNIDDSAIGKLSATMVGGFNEYFSNALSERMQKAMRASFEVGRYSRRAPLGYKNVTNPLPGTANIEPDDAAPLVARAFELIATRKHTTAEVLRVVNAEGLTTKKGKPVPMQTFVELLKNPVYKGVQRSKKYDEEKPGLWRPIVDERTFHAVQMILSGKKSTTAPHARRHPQFPLRVTLLCDGCGQPLTGGNVRGRGSKKYSYYWCRTAGCRAVKNTPVDKIEAEFTEYLKRLRADPQFVTKFLPVLETAWNASTVERTAGIRKAEADLEEQQERKKKLVNGLLDGKIDKQTYDEMKREADDLCEGLEEYLAHLGSQEMMSELFWVFSKNVLLDVSTAWKRGTVEQRQMFQKILFPNGLMYSKTEGILNTDKDCLFSQLDGFMHDYLGLASPTGFEPVLPP
jgi:site-specific DNA recombinase